MKMISKRKKILAISSGGGHWVELKRIIPSFEGHNVVFVTVNDFYRSEIIPNKFYKITDATRWDKLKLMKAGIEVFNIMLKEKPDVVVSTGAAPGLWGIIFGSLFFAKTIWIDSIANIQKLSLSGKIAGKFADLWITQWPNLAKKGGPSYKGKII